MKEREKWLAAAAEIQRIEEKEKSQIINQRLDIDPNPSYLYTEDEINELKQSGSNFTKEQNEILSRYSETDINYTLNLSYSGNPVFRDTKYTQIAKDLSDAGFLTLSSTSDRGLHFNITPSGANLMMKLSK